MTIFSAECRFSAGGEIMRNVLHYETASGWTAATRDAVANALFTLFAGTSGAAAPNRGIKDYRSPNVSYDGVLFTDVQDPLAPRYLYPTGVPGTATGDQLPLQTALVVSLLTPVGGRSGRGRVYIGGFTETANDPGSLLPRASDACINAVANGFDDMADALDGLAVPAIWGVYSRKMDDLYVALGIRVDNRWDTQRRRANRQLATAATTRVTGA